MSDLNYIDRDIETKIVGQNATGDSVNYVGADVHGNMTVIDYASGSVTGGTAASVSSLIGGQFNTALPTLTNGQQSAIQLDSSGRQIISPLTNSSVVKAQLQDNSGNGITSTTINTKQRLDTNLSSEAQTGSTVPFSTIQVGGVNPSGVLKQVSINRDGLLNVSTGTDKSVFGPLVVASRVQQISADFSETLVNNNITQITTGTGSVSLASANASVSTGTGTTSSAQIVSIGTIDYLPGREMYAQYTAAFTTPTSSASTQLTGLYNGTDGLLIGYNGLNFSIGTVAGGVSTFVSSASFNVDTLTGSANSLFTRAGVPEAVNFTFKNVYRIRAGWLGAAPIFFEIMSPDGIWVTFHIVRQPNSSLNPSFLEPSLPITIFVTKTASDSTNLKITTTSWDAGVVDVSGQTDTSDSGTITALNGTVIISIESQSTIVANVTGTWTGVIQVQGDVGDGTWNPIYAINTNGVADQTLTANATLIIACAGFTSVRLIGTSWTSGTANINWVASSGTQAIVAQAIGNIASGTPDSGNPIKIGGVYNAVLPVVSSGSRVDLQLDANGRLLTSSVSVPTTASKFSFGSIVTSAVTQVAVESTAYTETTTNSTMTIVSNSANDSSAGTGARTVTVTYLDQTGAGPFTTLFTMNGTSVVTASVSNMCFIEKIQITTVGSGGSNAGIITLKTGGAATVGTVAVGTNETFWAHHYVPSGKTSYITGYNVGNNGSSSGQTSLFILKVETPTIANTPELQVSDFITIPGGATSITRVYNSPIQVIGPARIRAYVSPGATSTYTSYSSFDYIDN